MNYESSPPAGYLSGRRAAVVKQTREDWVWGCVRYHDPSCHGPWSLVSLRMVARPQDPGPCASFFGIFWPTCLLAGPSPPLPPPAAPRLPVARQLGLIMDIFVSNLRSSSTLVLHCLPLPCKVGDWTGAGRPPGWRAGQQKGCPLPCCRKKRPFRVTGT